MRVTFINPGHTLFPGGGVRVVYEYANYLVRRGHTVNMICPYRIDPPPESLRNRTRHTFTWWRARLSAAVRSQLGYSRLRWLSIDPRIKLLYVPGLDARFIPDADAVFATFWRTAEYVNAYPSCKGEKFYLIQHYETWAGPKDRIDATWRTPMHKVVVSDWLRELGKTLGAEDIHQIAPAVDHQMFQIHTQSASRKPSVLGFYSDLSFKGTADAIAVFRRLHERDRDLSISMIGLIRRGKDLPRWIKYYRNPSPESLVREIYNSHAIYVCASYAEGWPNPPAEALACGCALITTDCLGARDYAVDGLTALVSAPGDRDALYRNLCRLLEDTDLRRRLAEQGASRIRKITWDNSGAALENHLLDVVGASQSTTEANERSAKFAHRDG